MVKNDDIVLQSEFLLVPNINIHFRIGLIQIMKSYMVGAGQSVDQYPVNARAVKSRMGEQYENIFHLNLNYCGRNKYKRRDNSQEISTRSVYSYVY